MTHHHTAKSAPFGAVLGIGPGSMPVYSSDYETADPAELPTRQHYRSHVDGIYMGHKWQCVGLARRWMYLNKGYIFDDIAMAYDIFRLRSVPPAGQADGVWSTRRTGTRRPIST